MGVDVPASEDMSRQDYDAKLVPPVKAMVDRLKAKGRTPAILLVYGIPLRVGSAPVTIPDMELKSLATAKVKEYQAQAVPLVHQLDRLTGAADVTAPVDLPHAKISRKIPGILGPGAGIPGQATGYPGHRGDPGRDYVPLDQTGRDLSGGPSLDGRNGPGEKPAPGAPTKRTPGITSCHPGGHRREGVSRHFAETPLKETAAAIRYTNGLLGELKFWYEAQQLYDKSQTMAAVDSEMTLIMAGSYQKNGWLPNPFNLRFDRLPVISRSGPKP